MWDFDLSSKLEFNANEGNCKELTVCRNLGFTSLKAELLLIDLWHDIKLLVGQSQFQLRVSYTEVSRYCFDACIYCTEFD